MSNELHLAALRNDAAKVATLLNAGNSVDTTDDHGRTPAMIAARFGAVDTLRLLTERGADLSCRSGLGATALRNAVEHRKPEAVALLLASGANPDETYPHQSEPTPLMKAAFAGDFATTATLLSYGADPNHASSDSYTALHKAVGGGDRATVQLLLEAGARIDQPDLDGDTPLHWAIWTGATEIALLLLDRGADFRHRNLQNRSAYDLAQTTENMTLLDHLKALTATPG